MRPSGETLEETDGTNATDYVYAEGRPIAVLQGTSVYFIHSDRQGIPQLVTDASRTRVWTAGGGYDPFGTPGMVTGTITQNLRLPGQFFDAESGLNHNGARDYLPQLGRYTETDPSGLAGGLNTFAYAYQNPLTFTDPTGLDSVAACFPESATQQELDAITAEIASIIEQQGLRALGEMAMVLSLSGDTPQEQLYLNHYTNAAGYSGIEKDQEIIPSPSTGYVFLTPQLYSSGLQAQQMLALSTTPIGYFTIPIENVGNFNPPTLVQPYNGQPGGGLEIKVNHAVPITNSPWTTIKP
jgi:RHS repeat-associated protein